MIWPNWRLYEDEEGSPRPDRRVWLDYYEKAVYEMIEEGEGSRSTRSDRLVPGTYRTVNFYDILNAEQPVRFHKDYYIHQPLAMTVTKGGK